MSKRALSKRERLQATARCSAIVHPTCSLSRAIVTGTVIALAALLLTASPGLAERGKRGNGPTAANVDCDGCVGDNAKGSHDIAPGAVGATQIDPSEVQRRLTGSCGELETFAGVTEDGQVLCNRDDDALGDATPDCAPGDFARLGADGQSWECLSTGELALELGLPSTTAFVTSQMFLGDLVSAAENLGFTGAGGLAAGDFICTTLANAEGSLAPAGNYTAWLSTFFDPAFQRIPQAGPYVLVDGTVVASKLSGLANAGTMPLEAPLNLDETGTPANTFTLTGTNIEGGGLDLMTGDAIPNCMDYTSSELAIDNQGLAGSTTAVDPTWTQLGNGTCGDVFALYCFGPK